VVRVEFLGSKRSEASGFNYKDWRVTCPERATETYEPPFDEWAADSTYQGELPPDEGAPPWEG
jgi:hypothetical protein